MLHASSQELESVALSACHRLSAAAMDAARGKRGLSPCRSVRNESPDGSPRSGWGRLACHVLATASQVLALGEVRRVDHSLKVRRRQEGMAGWLAGLHLLSFLEFCMGLAQR